MPILAAIGNINTVVGFGNNLMNALQAGSFEGALEALFGVDAEGDTTIDRMQSIVESSAREIKDLNSYIALDGGVAKAKTALDNLKGWIATPDDYDPKDIIDDATEALRLVIENGDTILDLHANEATSTAVFSALSLAMQARLTVAEALQDGAFALKAISAPMREAADLLDRAGETVRREFSVDVQIRYDPGGFLAIDDFWYITADTPIGGMETFRHILEDVEFHEKPNTHVWNYDSTKWWWATTDDFTEEAEIYGRTYQAWHGLKVEESFTVTLGDYLDDPKYDGQFDIMNGGHREVITDWLETAVKKASLRRADSARWASNSTSLAPRSATTSRVRSFWAAQAMTPIRARPAATSSTGGTAMTTLLAGRGMT